MPDRNSDHPLHQDLRASQEQLQEQLDEVCDEVVVNASTTEELIKIEETLAAATEAAKEVVSLRRRLDRDAGLA